MTFDDWILELANVAARHNCLIKDDLIWRTYYENGATPEAAWEDECARIGKVN